MKNTALGGNLYAWCVVSPSVKICFEKQSADNSSFYSPSQPHRGNQAGSAHTVKALVIPLGREGLVYNLVGTRKHL